MKLLSPSQVKKQKTGSEVINKQRLVELDNQINLKTQELNGLKNDFTPEKQKIVEAFREFEKEYQAKKTSLAAEVRNLELRKQIALRPSQELEREAEVRNTKSKEWETSLVTRELKLEKHEADLKGLGENLENREQKLVSLEFEIYARDEESLSRAEQIRLEEKALSEARLKFNLEVNQTEARLAQKEALLDSQLKANEIAEAGFAKREADLNARERGLRDRYATLERAVTEFNKKNGSS